MNVTKANGSGLASLSPLASAHLLWVLLSCLGTALSIRAQTNTLPNASVVTNLLVMLEGKVEVAPVGTEVWSPGRLNQVLHPGDRVRTGERSRAAVYLASGATVVKGESSQFEVPPSSGISLIEGLYKIFDRLRTRRSQWNLPGATAAVRGTDFLVRVDTNGFSEVTVLDGEVVLRSRSGEIELHNNERGTVDNQGTLGGKTSVIEAPNDLIQWSLYYPGVLNVDELLWAGDETLTLSSSLAAYREGDLLQAVANYPWERQPISDDGRAYRAALWLSVGQVDKAMALMEQTGGSAARGVQQLVAAVKFQNWPETNAPVTSSEWLAESYYRQSLFDLPGALRAARAAVTNAPDFGFGWERVAELEFSFGRTTKALSALETALRLSPRNAQAIALKGFLLSAQDKISEAKIWFEHAIAVDSALGNAWLGRGLCSFRQGHRAEGLRDLTVAASLESQRSLLRSYLGKAFAENGDEEHATKELSLANELDPRDPTPWLYGALLHQQEHRFNEGIHDLEESLERNENRRLYRSRLLLDEDRAVRSASLAAIYRDAGLTNVSVREAAYAVIHDYANYSAHLFLANSFDALRDPTRFNLRYETAWFNELLLANLLAPVGAGTFSQNISQQEYSRLFDPKKFGLTTTTDVRSDGQYHEIASQFGTYGELGYAFDLDYQHNNSVGERGRPNNGLDRIEWYSTAKWQLNPADTLLLLTKYQDYHSGDNFQYFDPTKARTNFVFDEYQSPIAVAGYHHEWQPGIHTLLLGGRLENDQRFSDLNAAQQVIERDLSLAPSGLAVDTDTSGLDVQHRIQLNIYTAEAQQIFQNEHQTLLVGARWQGGAFDTHSFLTNSPLDTNAYPPPTTKAQVTDNFERISGYVYETVKLPCNLNVAAGLTYEHLQFPENFRAPPIQSGQETRERLNPKAALIWQALPEATIRAIYAKSLGGVSLDESFRLEPTQLAGFGQAFRTLIPESLVGSVSAPDYEIWGGAFDLKFKTSTYVGLQGEFRRSQVRQTIGVFDRFRNDPSAPGLVRVVPSGTRQRLDYGESSVGLSVNQLLSEEWALGANYLFLRSELDSEYPALAQVIPSLNSTLQGDLHQLNFFLRYNHASGFFARADANWYGQESFIRTNNLDGKPVEFDLPIERFWQINLSLGYRLPRQRGDLTVGLLNVTDKDYRLNPVTPYADLPRERVFYARLRLRF